MGCSVLLVFMVVLTTAGYGYVHYRFGQIRSVKVPGLRKTTTGRPMNLLVVGSDSRAGLDDADGRRYGDIGGQRNDVTLIVRVEPASKRISLLSIPRDLVVPIAGTGTQNRVNAAFSAGPGQLVQTIEQNFGIPINHYVLIDFHGFQAIVDALDGIDVRFPYPARDALSGLDVARPAASTSTAPARSPWPAAATSPTPRAASGAATRSPTSAASGASTPSSRPWWRRPSPGASPTRCAPTPSSGR